MYLDDEASNDWMAASGGSFPLASGFGNGTEELASNLLGFLFDFRAGGKDDAPAAEQPGADGFAGPVPGANVRESSSRFDVVQEHEAWMDDPYAGSDRQVAADWWMAADGRWYAPELHPDFHAHPQEVVDLDALQDEPAPEEDEGEETEAKRLGLKGLRRSR